MDDLAKRFLEAPPPRILVLGDLILDRYIWGNASRVSPEAPVLVLQAEQQEVWLGGGASVALLLRALDAEVSLAGVIGSDSDGRTLSRLLDDEQIIPVSVMEDSDRRTTCKERFIGRAAERHPHQILRVDYEQTNDLHSDLANRMIAVLQRQIPQHDALLVSDYAKGACTPGVLSAAMQLARQHGVPVVVDPARVHDIERYEGANLLTPNRVEAELLTGAKLQTPDDALHLAASIVETLRLDAGLITLDSDGIAYCTSFGEPQHCPTRRRAVYDITGAGDMVLAIAGFCAASGLDLSSPPSSECFTVEEMVKLANIAGGIQVERIGVSPVRRMEIVAELGNRAGKLEKRVSLDQLVPIVQQHKTQNRRTVFTNGCFDLLHVGHVTYLQEAAALGDVLIVAINSDETVRRLKGVDRPIISQEDRSRMLAALACVDYVVVFDEDTPHRLLHALQPDVLVKGGTYSVDQVVGKEVVEAYGGTVAVTGAVSGRSTTQIVSSLQRVSARLEPHAQPRLRSTALNSTVSSSGGEP